MNRLLIVVLLLLAVPVAATGSQPASDPRGIYLNQFTGGFAGAEWFQVTPLPGAADRYRLADIHGGGFDATIRNGVIVIDDDIGSGSFTVPDAFTVTPTLGGMAFNFESRRVPLTSADSR